MLNTFQVNNEERQDNNVIDVILVSLLLPHDTFFTINFEQQSANWLVNENPRFVFIKFQKGLLILAVPVTNKFCYFRINFLFLK